MGESVFAGGSVSSEGSGVPIAVTSSVSPNVGSTVVSAGDSVCIATVPMDDGADVISATGL